MSYILDALRRADAERSRGAVPGLHAQNIPADDEPAARRHAPLLWAAGGAGAVLVAVVVVLVVAPWRGPAVGATALAPAAPLVPTPQLDDGPRPGDPAVTTARGETPAARAGAIDPAALPVEPPITRANRLAGGAPPATDRAPPPAIVPGLVPPRLAARAAEGRVATLEPRGALARGAAAAPADRGPDAGPPGAPADTAPVEHYGAAIAPAPAPTSARATAVPNINDLPPATRAGLPRLAVGGAIYSASPADRMVILNGQVFHEGDKPAADTVLEQIRLKSAVLNFRGQRYEITF